MSAIEQVVVAGGGFVGWSAAAAIKRKLPKLRVTMVALPPSPAALAERIGSTLPSTVGFHGDLGLREEDAIVRARSGFRLGTSFEGWNQGLPGFVHAYARHGEPFGTTSFHHQWIRLAKDGGAAPFDAHSPAAALARAGRFLPEAAPPGAPAEPIEFGLTLDLPRYGRMIEAFARHVGVEALSGPIADVRLNGDGFVEALRLADGSEVPGHLFVDCTGPDAQLRSRLDDRFEDWSDTLLCDRIVLAESPPDETLPLLDEVHAHAAGWQWRSPSLVRTAHGIVYSSRHLSDSDAGQMLREAGAHFLAPPVALRQGRRPEPWLRNCVAVGESAVAVEPLEWTNLHLAHSAIDRIVAMMPGRDCAPVELQEFNRQSEAEAARVRDFLLLHYIAAARPEPFWAEAAGVALPPSLRHTLDLFRERGRLPFHEEETFSRESWLAVLLGQGIMPRRVDPLAESLPLAQAQKEMGRMREALGALVAAAPTHGAFLQNLMRQSAR